MASDFMYLHGRLFLSDRTAGGEPDNFVESASVSDIELSLESSEIEHMDKSIAISSLDLNVQYAIKASGKIIVDSATAAAMALNLYGTSTTVAGGAFVAANAVFPTGIAVGDIMPIPGGRTHVSSLVIVDSTGSPVTLTLGTHYEIVSADGGLVRFLDVTTGSVIQPFKASGTEAAGKGVGVFQARTAEKYARFVGINVADDDAVKVIDLYRLQLAPTSSWKIMGDGSEVTKFELAFKLLKDTTKTTSATFGQFGRYRTDA